MRNFSRERCYVIAEIGGNFTCLEEAQKLIDLAVNCRVDAVKLQTYKAETIASKNAIFEMENTGTVLQREIFKKYELDEKTHQEIFSYIEDRGLDWFSTPSHMDDVELLERCGVSAHKIGSDDAVNIPFLKGVAKTFKPIILSTGMCTLEEVRGSVDAILSEGNEQLYLLHCVTNYPTHPESANLAAIQTLKKEFPNLVIGYSDHTIGPIASLTAVAMGAEIIERHFTHDVNAEGPDHMLSSDPDEMTWLVESIRNFEKMRGNGLKVPAKTEMGTRKNNRKSIILVSPKSHGDIITENDVAIMRPGVGIEPRYLQMVIGRRASKPLSADHPLNWSDLC